MRDHSLMKPQLETITLRLQDQPVAAGAKFKLNIEARGNGLQGDGAWLHIILKGKLLKNLVFTKRPECVLTELSKSELWQFG